MAGIYSFCMLFLWLLAVPACLGFPFAGMGTESGKKRAGTALVCGYMVMWALFQGVALAFILTSGSFDAVVYGFAFLAGTGALAGAGWFLVYRFKKPRTVKAQKSGSIPWKIENKQERFKAYLGLAVWCVFIALVLYQVIMSGMLAFADGDDAFYIPVSAAAEASGKMYRTIPYTGESTQLDVRHGLAPFPVWIAFLSRFSGIHATILAQSILGGVLLLLCYLIYSRIANLLFAGQEEGIPYFMLFVSLLILFGNYSFYTSETFLMTRTSQGKAVLGSLIIPFLFWCLLQAGREYRKDYESSPESKRPRRKGSKEKLRLGILMVLATAASWLCSSFGTFLCAALIGTGGLVISLAYRNYRAFIYAAVCVLPSAFFAVFYILLQ